MKVPLLTLLFWGIAASVQAGVPMFNATCGKGVKVHADQGGPVFINGKRATLKRFNENYYEARYQDVTISVAVSPDGSPLLSATWRGGRNGVCTVKAPDLPNSRPGS